jgi:two-component system nitrogen regulation response regulator NtrX
MKSVLIVDDEKNIRETLKDVLEDEGYKVLIAEDGRKALEMVRRYAVDVVLLDLWLPEIGGMEVLDELSSGDDFMQIIIISGHGTIDTAVRATKMGAFDFIEKPLSIDRVIKVVDHAFEICGLHRENTALREKSKNDYLMVPGVSRAYKQIEATIESCAASNSRVLITGENGTGKEVVARQIHEKSMRRNFPFVAVNCAAIPQTLIESELFGYEKGAFTGAFKNKRGKFELADGGTIFLDEIADMSIEAQSKVLRILEEMQFEPVGGVIPIKIDVRVIAATNKELKIAIKKGEFREDLYYRLNVVPIHILPLRERREDISGLIEYYNEFFARENNKKRKNIAKEALRFLNTQYLWPGNIRELKNLIERLSILTKGEVISLMDVKNNIPHHDEHLFINSSAGLKEARDSFERNFIVTALRENNNNITKAAEVLKVERSNLYKHIKRLAIEIKR